MGSKYSNRAKEAYVMNAYAPMCSTSRWSFQLLNTKINVLLLEWNVAYGLMVEL